MTENNTIGFLLIDVQPSHQDILNHINNISKLRPFIDCVLFNSNYNYLHMSINDFYILHLNEAKYFRGPIVVFDDKSCEFLLNCISKQKILWMKDTIDIKSIVTADFNETYNKFSKLDTILCENEETYKIINTLWKPSILLKEIDYEKIISNIQI